MAITIIILVLSAVFFMSGKVRSDLVALCALVLLILFNILTPEEALSGFSNSVVIMMVGLFVVGGAIFQTGLAKMISSRILKFAGTSELKLFILIILVTAAIGAFVSNTATAVLLAPIALHSAVQLGLSPYPFLFAVTVAASMCFASPFSTPPNALVMPAGRYTFMDYVKVGLPLQIIMGVVMVFVLPLLFPF